MAIRISLTHSCADALTRSPPAVRYERLQMCRNTRLTPALG